MGLGKEPKTKEGGHGYGYGKLSSISQQKHELLHKIHGVILSHPNLINPSSIFLNSSSEPELVLDISPENYEDEQFGPDEWRGGYTRTKLD